MSTRGMVAAGGLQSLIGSRHPEAFVDEADAFNEADDAYDPTEFIDEDDEFDLCLARHHRG